MPKIHLRQPGFTYNACAPFTKTEERVQNLKETGHSRYIYQNKLGKLAFKMTWFMEILKIYLEQQLRISCYVIKNLILIKIQNMMDIIVDLLQWFITFLIKSLLIVVLKKKLSSAKNWQKITQTNYYKNRKT